jgi:signal peptidase I
MDCEAQRRAVCCELVIEVARSAGEVRLEVIGASMLPSLWPGDVLTVRRCNFAELQPGQIVLYRRAEKLITHRVVRIAGDELIARGDARPHYDAPARGGAVVGRVVGIDRNGRCVSTEQFVWQRMVSWILRRSELCTRILLRAAGWLRRGSAAEPAWMAASLIPTRMPADER